MPPDRKFWEQGHLNRVDELPYRSTELGGALQFYSKYTSGDHSSLAWQRAYRNIENLLFVAGRHYPDDMLFNRLVQGEDKLDGGVVREAARSLPKPVNDFLGRYIETNVALLTENRPIPRVDPKSSEKRDRDAAELSELVVEFLWEALGLLEAHRELARMILTCGTAWLEVAWDPTAPRLLAVPLMKIERASESVTPNALPGAPPIQVPSQKLVPVRDKDGNYVYSDEMVYGEITTKHVSPFEMHFPNAHAWNGDDMGWVLRESYTSREILLDRFKNKDVGLRKSDGWDPSVIDNAGSEPVSTLPLWWWERMAQIVEGNGPSLYIGDPSLWKDYVVVRYFDRKPNPTWPRGRTVIVVGDKVLYDSPKKIGARAYDPRWPRRWHPYVHYRWEAMAGCFPPEAEVVLENGMRRQIELVTPGMRVASKGAPRSVTNKFEYKEESSLRELSVVGASSLRGTSEHVLPVIRKEVVDLVAQRGKARKYQYARLSEWHIEELPLCKISPGDYVLSGFTRDRTGPEKLDTTRYLPSHWRNAQSLTPGTKPLQPLIPIDQNFLRLLGLYLAEGSRSSHKRVKFSFGRNEEHTLAAETRSLIWHVFGRKSRLELVGGSANVTFDSSQAVSLFESLVGRGSAFKHLSDSLFFYPGSLLPLVGGWIDGDGCSSKHKAHQTSRASTVSKDLADQIVSILLDEGIPTRLDSLVHPPNRRLYTLHWDTIARRGLAPFTRKFELDTAAKTARQGFWLGGLFARRVTSNKEVPYCGPVFDLEVEKDHHYQVGGTLVHNSPYGRALVTKLLPKIKRINSIDTTSILYRRAAPTAAWLLPRGASAQEGMFSGRPGAVITYDARQTNNQKPEPIYPPEFPKAFLEERARQFEEMEILAGTEEILRGQRPVGVNSASMLNVLRKQALASRSSTLQAWDESHELVASILLQETIKNVKADPIYAERLRIIGREKSSRQTIATFSGSDLSDNVQVRIDIGSMALVSREADEAKAMDFLQYAPNLINLPMAIRNVIMSKLHYDKALEPQGPDVERAKNLVSWIKQGNFENLVPFPEDDPYIFYETFLAEKKDETFYDLAADQQQMILAFIDAYQMQIQAREQQKYQMQMQMMQMQTAMRGGHHGGGMGGGMPGGGQGGMQGGPGA